MKRFDLILAKKETSVSGGRGGGDGIIVSNYNHLLVKHIQHSCMNVCARTHTQRESDHVIRRKSG